MNYDPNMAAGLGIGAVVFALVIYFASIALVLWIGYLIVRTAVKNGILRADEERARRGYGAPPAGGPRTP